MTFYRTNAVLLASLVVGVSMAGCTEDEPAQTTEVGSSYEALAVQLQNCTSNALDCYQAADCDEAAEGACRDELKACREATRDAYRAYHQSVRACFRAKLECVHNAWSDGGGFGSDGGASDFDACRDEFNTCVEADRPIPAEPGPCMSGLRECVQANVEWGQDGSGAALHDCLSEAHTCIQNRLPMCEDDGGPGGAGGAGGEGGAAGVGETGGVGGAGGVGGEPVPDGGV